MPNPEAIFPLHFFAFQAKYLTQIVKIHYIMNQNTIKNMIFSFIIPGLGQYLNNDSRKGLFMFAGAVALHLFIWFFMNNPLGSLANTAYHAYAAYDIYKNY